MAGRSRVCSVCGSCHHTERYCPNRHNNQRAVSSYRRHDCRICGKVGHFARICPQYTADQANERLVFEIDRLSVVDSDDDESIFTVSSYQPRLQDDLAYTEDAKVYVKEREIGLHPAESFEDPALGLGANELLTNIMSRCRFKELTTIQKHALPIILSGKDVLACAHTGTGKTGAFLIPLVKLLSQENTPVGAGEVQCPRALVIAPTRELAIQIYNEARKFAFKIPGCKPRLAYGGASMKEQIEEIRRGCDILVGVPGRVRHFVEEGLVCLKDLSHFVLDEADRMLDMGFKGEMYFLADSARMPPISARQTLMFSATFSSDVLDVAKDFLKKEPRFIGVGSKYNGMVGVIGDVAPHILQQIEMLDMTQKKPRLREILNDLILLHVNQQLEKYVIETSRNKGCDFPGFMDHVLHQAPENLVLIFVETKRDAKSLRTYLCDYLTRTYVGIFRQRFPEYNPDSTHDDEVYDIAYTLNGDMNQMDRERVLSDFKERKYPILVATNVAARGLDIERLTHVINYDMPRTIEEYINRVGRTGRAGRSGTSISFFQPDRDTRLAGQLAQVLVEAKHSVPLWLHDMTK